MQIGVSYNPARMNAPPRPTLPAYNGMALHRQLFLVLRERILRGTWGQGQPLPSEAQLCEEFGVSRITVRRAMADLSAQALVERRRGAGTFASAGVAAPAPDGSLGFVDTLRRSAVATAVQVIGVEHVEAPHDIAALLKLGPGEKALHALRLRMIDTVPVMFTDTWVPARLGRNVTRTALKKNAMYEVLLAQGVKFGRVVQELTAEIADPLRARHLQTEPGSALLKVTRLIHDLEARPVQHLRAYLPPERSRVLMDIQGEAMNTLSAGLIVHHVGGLVD